MRFDGKALEERRRAAGLNQEQLAVMAGTTASTISRLERGHRAPQLETIGKLASALNVPIESLFTTEEALA